MNNMRPIITSIFISLVLIGCTKSEEKTELKERESTIENPVAIKYATGFKVEKHEKYTKVTVPEPYQGADHGFTYILIPKGQTPPELKSGEQLIEVPISTIVCTSTTHIPLLDYLNETNALVGFPSTNYISSEKMRARINSGNVTELGVDNEMNLELLLNEEPDLVMAYTMSSETGQYRQIESAGIPVVINAEYLERHPLGRAEWIKFMALFFGKEKMADSVFTTIESRYLNLKEKVSQVADKPTIMSGIVYGDTWYLPGGDNYAAKLFNDAGGKYLWNSSENSGFLELSFESVFDKAHAADYWIGVGSFSSLEEMQNTEQRYANFEAFKNQNVYTYDARKGAKGGSEFLELGYLRPDLILGDLIKILHPEKMPDQGLYFHAQLH